VAPAATEDKVAMAGAAATQALRATSWSSIYLTKAVVKVFSRRSLETRVKAATQASAERRGQLE
jgi:hypothetical protein